MKAIRLSEVKPMQAFRLTKRSKVWYHLSVFEIKHGSQILVTNAIAVNSYKLFDPYTIVYVRKDK